MFCGARSFSHAADDDNGGSWASSPRPKRSKLKKSLSSLSSPPPDGGRAGRSANPYSANGLDKFEKLLAELEARKKKVLQLKKGSSEDTVRFRYVNTDDWIPVVIKRPQPPQPPKKKEKIKAVAAANEVDNKPEVADQEEGEEHHEVAEVAKKRRRRRRRLSWDWSVQSWAVVVVVVLTCLAFGRAFAVCWATIFWYVAPMAAEYYCRGSSSDNLRRRGRKKKKYGERLGSMNFRVTGGSTSMKVKKMGDGRSAGSGIT